MLAMLTGCSGLMEYFDRIGQLLGFSVTEFADMEYDRPDMAVFRTTLEDCCQKAETEKDFDTLQQIIWDFYSVYESFYTNYFLATIHYSKDLTDQYWEAENTFCSENSAEVDAGLDRLYRVLAQSPLRQQLEGKDYFGPDFFANYEGESIYDETFTAMLNREAQLINQYYAISGESAAVAYYSEEFFDVYGTQLAVLFRSLVLLRQEMAAYAGYDSYPEFAYDFHYARDYTVTQAQEYLYQIQEQLVPLYRQVNTTGGWDVELQGASEQQTFAYVQALAGSMGGVVQEAFDVMADAKLYDISYGKNKFNASFAVYLYDYAVPYVFVNPTMTEHDKLTFTHEFGHFCNQYASYGGGAGVDVSEIFSQGLEYLSLLYAEDGGNLEKIRMLTCLSTYVEQAAYASFEQQVYMLPLEEVTEANIQRLYEETGLAFGFDSWAWDSRDYVCINHFFTSPMYIISYVVSNDAALQLYQMEKAEKGSGLKCYTDHLTSQEAYFLAFLEQAGLQSPFDPGRLEEVRKTLENVLK
jgi:oligoendopeptidase F